MRNGARVGAPQYGAAALVLSIIILPLSARATTNLLNNGDFTRGSGESVDGWRTDAWVLSAGATEYKWVAPHHSEPAKVEVFSRRDNDARWVQGLSLAPGWYHISVEARTRNVLPFFTGASVSVLEDGIISRDLRGDNDWTLLSLYLRVAGQGANVDVALRLGNYMSLTRGQAWFRRARVVKVAGPARDGSPAFDLGVIRKTETRGPIGRVWTLIAAFLGLGAATAIGWRMMTEPLQQQQSERVRRRRRA